MASLLYGHTNRHLLVIQGLVDNIVAVWKFRTRPDHFAVVKQTLRTFSSAL